MNAKIPAILMALATLVSGAQENPAPSSPKPASTPAATAPPPVRSPGPPPIVRLPVGDEPARPADPDPTPAPATGTTAPVAAPTNQQLGWSNDSLGLRNSADSVRTNRSVQIRGALPKVARPQKRTVGGFVTSFANLFNPFAPMNQGVGVTPENWYDGRNNGAPLPRGFRDERNHEASALLFSTPLGKDPDPDPDTEEPRRAPPLPTPP